MNLKRDRDMTYEDIWTGPNDLSEAEKAASRLDELLRKWSATGTLQSIRYPVNRPVSRSIKA